MEVASAVACAEELEGELTQEIERARSERLVLRSLDGAKIEARISERRAFEERAESLQERLRAILPAVTAPGNARGDAVLERLAEAGADGARLAGKLASIRALAQELSKINERNRMLAERALSMTRAYVRVLAPRPSAYDRRGAESSHGSPLSSFSRRA
jgi:flagellar biosynthesis/type III secretory pathway chaperone